MFNISERRKAYLSMALWGTLSVYSTCGLFSDDPAMKEQKRLTKKIDSIEQKIEKEDGFERSALEFSLRYHASQLKTEKEKDYYKDPFTYFTIGSVIFTFFSYIGVIASERRYMQTHPTQTGSDISRKTS